MVTAAETEGLDALVSDNVRAARARLRIRQADLAERLGWSRASVASLEDRRRRVTLADAVGLCSALGLTLTELLDGREGAEARRALGLEASGRNV